MRTPARANSASLSDGIRSTVVLQNGIRMPVLGLGVYQTEAGRTTQEAVASALSTGYRLIDTAALYGNEKDVGAAVRASGLPRDEVFITTKLWNKDQGYDTALRAFEESRRALDVDVVDLYLIHWPVSGKRTESWRALVHLLETGKCRNIGVSNYTVRHLEELLAESGVVPAVNQVEFSPFLFQDELLRYCRSHHIQLEAYAPLVRGKRMDHPTIARIAAAHHKTPAQVLIRWGLQHGVVEIPKSTHPDRIVENADVFDLELSPEEMVELDGLDEGFHTSWDPTTIE
jgi:diketogulonate reductase-like aldo/keto reductase